MTDDIDLHGEATAPGIGHAAFGDPNTVIAGLVEVIVEHESTRPAILFAGGKNYDTARRTAAIDFNAHVLAGFRAQHEVNFVPDSA